MDDFLVVVAPNEDGEKELNPSDFRPGGLEMAIGAAVLNALKMQGGDGEVTVSRFAK